MEIIFFILGIHISSHGIAFRPALPEGCHSTLYGQVSPLATCVTPLISGKVIYGQFLLYPDQHPP